MSKAYFSFFVVFSINLTCFFLQGGAMFLSSASFKNNESIARRFTCQGDGISPAFTWNNVTAAKSYLLMCEDPNAPRETFIHWILYNIPASTNTLPEQISAHAIGAQEGLNSANKVGYYPPCPPSGIHHYVFTLYALDTMLNFEKPPHKKEIDAAIEGHVISKDTLTGTYQKE